MQLVSRELGLDLEHRPSIWRDPAMGRRIGVTPYAVIARIIVADEPRRRIMSRLMQVSHYRVRVRIDKSLGHHRLPYSSISALLI